VFIVLIS